MARSIGWTYPKLAEPKLAEPGWQLTAVTDVPAAPDPRLADLGEAELVATCLAGRAEAFDILVARHRRTTYQLCYRFVNNHEDASDLSQDVFLRAFRGLRSFRGGSSFST